MYCIFKYYYLLFYSNPVISFNIKYTIIIIIILAIKNNIFFFLFVNSLKMGLNVVKKNPNSIPIKNLGNLYMLFQKVNIIIFY